MDLFSPRLQLIPHYKYVAILACERDNGMHRYVIHVNSWYKLLAQNKSRQRCDGLLST
jgi:hypothetical protein